jgi:hypothetical protein
MGITNYKCGGAILSGAGVMIRDQNKKKTSSIPMHCHFERSGIVRECGRSCGVEKLAFSLAPAKHKVPRLRSE